MVRTLAKQIKGYKKDTILTPVFTALEVIMEVLIPYITARIIDEGITGHNMGKIWEFGGIMIGMAILSLAFGVFGGLYGAKASTGFAKTCVRPCLRMCRRSHSPILISSALPASSPV